MKFLLYNGKIYDKQDVNTKIILTDEQVRIYRKIWFGYAGIPLFNENLDLLLAQAECLNIPFPNEFENRKELFRLTKRLLNKNRLFRSGYLNLQIWSNGSESCTLFTPVPSADFNFPYPDEAMLITYAGEKKYSHNRYNRYPFYNKPLWDAVLSETTGTQFRNAVILNENDMVCECAYANIFLIKNGKMITPSLSSGCFRDILYDLMIEAAKRTGIMTLCQHDIKKNELAGMDEIFIASEQSGFCRITGIDNKRFIHRHSPDIYQQLTEILKERCT